MRLPQDSVDVVVGGALPVAMETALPGAARVFTLRSAAVLLVARARPGAGLSCPFWTAGSVAAVAAGGLQRHTERRESRRRCGALNKIFSALAESGAVPGRSRTTRF